MKKRILWSLLVLAVMGFAVQYYLFNKPHRNIAAAKEDFVLSAAEFYKAYAADETGSNAKYLEKVIAVEGVIEELQLENAEEPTVALITGEEGMSIRCGFKKELLNEVKELKPQTKIKIKGKCDGLDMFGIVMTQCSLIK